MKIFLAKKCIPCEEGTAPLTAKEIKNILPHLHKDWQVLARKKIRREFVLKDFVRAVAFVNKVAKLAEQEDHHPDIHIFYRKVVIELWTHSVGGLSENDFILAAKADQVYNTF